MKKNTYIRLIQYEPIRAAEAVLRLFLGTHTSFVIAGDKIAREYKAKTKHACEISVSVHVCMLTTFILWLCITAVRHNLLIPPHKLQRKKNDDRWMPLCACCVAVTPVCRQNCGGFQWSQEVGIGRVPSPPSPCYQQRNWDILHLVKCNFPCQFLQHIGKYHWTADSPLLLPSICVAVCSLKMVLEEWLNYHRLTASRHVIGISPSDVILRESVTGCLPFEKYNQFHLACTHIDG